MRQLIYLSIVTISFGCLLSSCQSADSANKDSIEQVVETEEEKVYESLQAKLNERKVAFNAKASPEKKALYTEGIEAVVNSGIVESAKQKGDKYSNFSLTNAEGKNIELKNLLEQGHVILTWYRGGWCPYCNLTLARMQEELPAFRALGAQLVALTPELPDSSLSTKDKHNLQFEVLSDVGNEVAKEYGIVFKLIDGVAESYQNSFNLHKYNGDKSAELPLAATYVIDRNGIIQYAFLDADYRNRAEPSEIVLALQQLK